MANTVSFLMLHFNLTLTLKGHQFRSNKILDLSKTAVTTSDQTETKLYSLGSSINEIL